MRKVFVVLMVLALAVTAQASVGQVLIDDSLGAAPGAWTKVGGGPNARVDTDHGTGGDWAVGGSDGSGSSPAYDNYYFQSFALASGDYNVNISGWSKAWAGWWGGENFDWVQEAHLELWIDGIKAWSGTSSNNTNRDTWTLHSQSGLYTITSGIEVRLHSVKGNNQFGTGGLGAVYYDSRYDDIYLAVEAVPAPVPEPGTIVAALGLLGPAGLMFRRRKA